MTETRNRRSRLIVNPAVQSRIIVNISWPSATALAVVALLLGWFSMNLLDEALVAQVELPSLIPVLLSVMAFLVVSFGYMVFNALKFSHRIAGPMYRLQKTLETATGGDYSVRANLRTNDFLVEVADSLNEFLAHLELEASGLELGGGVEDVAAELGAGAGSVAGSLAGGDARADADAEADSGSAPVALKSASANAGEETGQPEGISAGPAGSLDEEPVGQAEPFEPGSEAEGAEVPDVASSGLSPSGLSPSGLSSPGLSSQGLAAPWAGPQGMGAGPRMSVDDLPGALPIDEPRGEDMIGDESELHLGVTSSEDPDRRADAAPGTGSAPLPGPIGNRRGGRRGGPRRGNG